MKDEKETSAARVSRLLEYMEREGDVRVREIPSLLHVSMVTAGHYAAALRACPWITFGREYACETERDRKLRLSKTLCFSTVSVERTQVRVMRYCPATGSVTRQSHALCDAISAEEALTATLGRVLGGMMEEERQPALIGLMVDRGVELPHTESLSRLSIPIESREELTVSALARAYGEQSVLYVHVGDVPTMLYVRHGMPMADLRPNENLQREWPTVSDARVSAIVKHASQVLSVLSPDRLIFETDGGGAHAFAEAVIRQATTSGIKLPPIETPDGMSLAERELLARLRERLAEKILRDAKKDC